MDRLTRRTPEGGIDAENIPAALERLAQYEDAEERGRLFIPEIKAALSDTVYTADKFGIYESEVAEFRFNRYHTESGLVLETGKGNQEFVDFREFSDNYCLKKAEAETMRERRRK